VVGSVRKFVGVRVAEFGFHNRLEGGDEAVVGNDPKLFHLGGQKDAGGRQQQRVNALERVAGVETLEVHSGCGDHLLLQLQVLAQHLNDCKIIKTMTL